MSTAINFASLTPGRRAVVLTTQDTSLTAPATFQTLVPSFTGGCKITEITVVGSQASIAAGVVRLFLWNGTTAFLFDEIVINTAVTGSNTAPGFRTTRRYENLDLLTTWTLRVTTSITQSLTVSANVAEY